MNQQEQEVHKWQTVYKEVRGAFDFRVANLNSQQNRIANVLVANGLIFGFLGASAGIFFDSKVQKLHTSILYVASMCSLALGLAAAVAALWPLIEPLSASQDDQKTKQFLRSLGKILSKPISVPWNKIAPHSGKYTDKVNYFLDPDKILNDAKLGLGEVELLKILSSSIVDNAEYSNHIGTIKFRRRWIRAQLIFIVLGVLLLIPALIFRLLPG
jgi:hypothetical protein